MREIDHARANEFKGDHCKRADVLGLGVHDQLSLGMVGWFMDDSAVAPYRHLGILSFLLLRVLRYRTLCRSFLSFRWALRLCMVPVAAKTLKSLFTTTLGMKDASTKKAHGDEPMGFLCTLISTAT